MQLSNVSNVNSTSHSASITMPAVKAIAHAKAAANNSSKTVLLTNVASNVVSNAASNVVSNAVSNVVSNAVSNIASNAVSNLASKAASITISNLATPEPILQEKTTSDNQVRPRQATGQTGPKSVAGKRKIRFNALKQGRYAKSTLLPFEDEKLYAKHSKEVFAALGPINYIETQLVDEYANAIWRIYRHETRGAYEREQILKRLTPTMAAQMLGIADTKVHKAPEYLIKLAHVIPKTESQQALNAIAQYVHLQKNAKGIANFNLVWRQYSILFEALSVWVDDHGFNTPLFNGSHEGLSLAWQKNPIKVLESLEALCDELYYVAHWEKIKPAIRVWMESYYFLQRAEQYRINQDEQLLMKERNYAHSLLDRLSRLRKTGVLTGLDLPKGD